MAKGTYSKQSSNANPNADDKGKKHLPSSYWLKILRIIIKIIVVILSIIWVIKTKLSFETLIAFLLALLALMEEAPIIQRVFEKYYRLVSFISIAFLIASIIILSIAIISSRVVFKIKSPTSNQQIEQTISSVNGIYRNIPDNDLIWIIVQDKENGLFYLGDAMLATKRGTQKKGGWDALNLSVGSFSDSGKLFYIWAILIKENSTSHQQMLDWKNKKDSQGNEALPSYEKGTVISVVRK